MALVSEEDVQAINKVIEDTSKAMGVDQEDTEHASTVEPGDPSVALPVGLWDPFDGLRDSAEVRELTGFDEEYIAKAKNLGTAMTAVLERAVVSLGGKPLDKKELALLTTGDRLALMLGVHRVTWGEEIEVFDACSVCEETSTFHIPINDIPVVELDDKEAGRTMDLELPSGRTAKLKWPSGVLQQKVLGGTVETGAEMTTLVIEDCVTSISGVPVMNEQAARGLPMKDRRAITDFFANNDMPGPNLDEVPTTCPECDADITVAIPVGAVFPG